jgi:hypothetical protein
MLFSSSATAKPIRIQIAGSISGSTLTLLVDYMLYSSVSEQGCYAEEQLIKQGQNLSEKEHDIVYRISKCFIKNCLFLQVGL